MKALIIMNPLLTNVESNRGPQADYCEGDGVHLNECSADAQPTIAIAHEPHQSIGPLVRRARSP